MKYAAFELLNLDDPLLARKYAQLNSEAVRAIQDRPLLYAPQFVRSLESWKTEFASGKFACWICVTPNIKTGQMSLEEGQWIGFHQLHGPLSSSEYNFFRDQALETGTDDFCTRWIAGRLYIKPDHRNTAAGNAVYKASMEYLAQRSAAILRPRLAEGEQRLAQVRVQLTAYTGTASFGIHRAGTLRAIREVTRIEDMEYDGLLEQVPPGLLCEDDYKKYVGTLSESIEEVLVIG